MNTTEWQVSFDAWMKQVDEAISSILYGMTSADLPDFTYSDMFEDGMKPRQAARQAIRNAGGDL
jgi:hypothetical protein